MDCEKAGVVPNRLCGNCDRIVGKSITIQRLTTANSYKLRNTRKAPTVEEIFFHSPRLEIFMSSVASGCHLCSIVAWDEKKFFRHQLQSSSASALEDPSGIIQVSLTKEWASGKTIMSFDVVTDVQTSEGQMEDADQMDSVLNDRFHALQGWERWKGGRSLGVVALQKFNDLVFPQSTLGPSAPLSVSTDSSESVATVRYWLNECLQNHHECQSPFKTAESRKLPTRLIVVGNGDKLLRARLVETKDLPNQDDIHYLTLSHCWGNLNMNLMLRKGSYKTFLEHGIPVELLRTTLRDAMGLTRRLGYRYIWIDSLCIIQDSPEDWAVEALTMKDVYGNTSCNIAALGKPGDSCFVERNPLHYFPCYIHRNEWEGNEGVYAIRYYNPKLNATEDYEEGPPLLRRGWAVQEKLLSSRVIYMGKPQIYWECAQYRRSEGLPVMEGPAPIVPFHNQLVCAKSDFRALRGQTLESESDELLHEAQYMIELSKCWMRMVSDYCNMDFTKKEDRFIALAGVSEAIGAARGWTYVAGTWKEFWPFDLLWARYEPDPQPLDLRWRMDRFKPVIPSWSWAYKSTDSMSKANPAVHFLPLRYQHLFDPDTLRLTITSLATAVDFSCPNFVTQHSLTRAQYGDIKLSLKGEVLRGRQKPLLDKTGVQIHWDVKVPLLNDLLFLLLMRWTESGDEQQAGLVLMKQLAPVSKVKQQMYFRVGVWEDYSPQTCRGRRLLFPPSGKEEVVCLC